MSLLDTPRRPERVVLNLRTHASHPNLWSVPREWDGQECFVVCGGESVTNLDLSRLEGRRVIVINSSFKIVPRADFLIFSDQRWWNKWRHEIRSTFRGRVVTVTPMMNSKDYLILERQRSGGLSPRSDTLALWHTTTTAATNLAVHLGVRVINYLGLDGRGGWHHEPHPWPESKNKFHYHGLALLSLADALRALDIEAYNACQCSSHKMFSHRSFEDMTR